MASLDKLIPPSLLLFCWNFPKVIHVGDSKYLESYLSSITTLMSAPFVDFLNHKSNSSWFFKVSSICSIVGKVKINLKLLKAQIFVHWPKMLITVNVKVAKSLALYVMHTRLLFNHSSNFEFTYPFKSFLWGRLFWLHLTTWILLSFHCLCSFVL